MKILLLSLLLFTTITVSHPHHHSLSVLEYNKDSQQFELSIRLLTEDFNKLKEYKIEKYINKHLNISIGQHILLGNFKGKEKEVEYTWLYFTYDYSVSKLNKVNKLNVNNSILTNTNENQFNTVQLKIFNQTQSHNFSSQEPSYSFVLSAI